MRNRQRALIVFALLGIGFTVISARLVHLQIVEHDKYRRLAIENHCRRIELPPRRGEIVDTTGEPLAQTQPRYEVRIDGQNLWEIKPIAEKLEQVLHLPPRSLVTQLNTENRYQLAGLGATEEMVQELKEFEQKRLAKWREVAKKQGWKRQPERFLNIKEYYHRVYPNAAHASHLIGFLDNTQVGASGVERAMEAYLAGIAGERWIEKDVRGREIAAYRGRDQRPVDGFNVVLTLNLAIQHIVEETLDKIQQKYNPAAAFVIVMEPRTGDVLALANRPTFDLNQRRGVPVSHFRNRCLTDVMEPGSTYKIVTMAAALNERLFTLDSQIYCENGRFFYADRWLHDHEPYGMMTLQQVMARSSNIGFAKIALELGDLRLYDYAVRFGFGKPTQLLPGQGESAGLLRPVSKWSKLSITRIPMGHEVAATPMQMITAMCVIANGGRLVSPRLIKSVNDAEGRVVKFFPPSSARQVIHPNTARLVSRSLAAVVSQEGTAQRAILPGYTVAGKTGTSQKFVNGAYSKEKYLASFIGYLPEENPEFVVLVMVDEPKGKEFYGGQVAAPAFREIAEQVVKVLRIPERAAPAQRVETATL